MSNAFTDAIRQKYFVRLTLLIITASLSGCREQPLAEPTPQMDAKPQHWIRVLLSSNAQACSFQSHETFRIEQTAQDFEKLQKPVSVTIQNKKITFAEKTIDANEITILTNGQFIFNVNDNDYRGNLKIRLNSDANSFDVINLVPLEPYLAGVVGAEMPNYWEPSALQAQTIAARTYCLYIKKRFGESRHWDVKKTQAHQVYNGLAAESKQVWSAVNKTAGQVLICKYQDGSKDIFPTYYSSNCAGHTEDSKNVFGDTVKTLSGVYCPYCKKIAKPDFFLWKTVQFRKKEISDKLLEKYSNLKPLGKIKKILISKKSDYENFSRLTMLKLIGSTGKTDFIRAEDFRLTVNPDGQKIKSTVFRITDKGDKWLFTDGCGYGHGVGMCQCGAQAMAREGKSAKKILSYYYPSCEIRKIY